MIPLVEKKPLTQEELTQWLDKRRAELIASWGDGDFPPREVRGQMIEMTLREEAAELLGIDPAAAEATAMIREHGLRRAHKMFSDPDLRAAVSDSESHDRVAQYIREEYERQTPSWRRRLGL